MRLTKKYLIIGVLAVSAALAGSACGKKDDTNSNQNTNVSEVLESKEETETVKKDDDKKAEIKVPQNLANHGDIDLEANPDIPVFSKQANLTFGYKDKADMQPLCFYQDCIIDKPDAEIMHTEFTSNLEEVPEKMKKAKSLWGKLLRDDRIYYMVTEQDFEVIVDKSEKVIYNGFDFIREEGHIQVSPKDSSDTRYPSLTVVKYVAFYYTYEYDGVNTLYKEGMGMSVWGTVSGEEGLNSYDLIKETADKSMATLQTTNRLGQYN